MEDPPAGLDLSESQVPRILGVNIATLILAILAVALRFISRRVSNAKFWWDDWLTLPALVAALVMCLVSITYMINHGLGKHVWVGPPDAAIAWAKGLFVSEICYTTIICSIKFSLLAFYWRIFKQTHIRIPIYVLGGIVSCWGTAVLLVSIFQCIPVNGFWDRYSMTSDAPKCGVVVTEFFEANSIPNIITDVAILILPIPYIWKLHLPSKQKLGLISIFILGTFVVGVSIARFTFIINLNTTSPDITWNFVDTQLWTAIECHIGIVCACLPSLRPLLNLLYHGSVSRTKPSSGGENLSHDRPVLIGRPRPLYDRDSNSISDISGGTSMSTTKDGRKSIFDKLSENEKGPPVPEKKRPRTRSSVDRPLPVVRDHILVRTDMYVTY